MDMTKSKRQVKYFYDIEDILDGLDSKRPGIGKRVWEWILDMSSGPLDVEYRPYKGKIFDINLYFYGVGEEYPLKSKYYLDSVKDSKSNHPKAFVKGNHEYEIRLDLNLIWQVYEDDMNELDPESFSVVFGRPNCEKSV